VPILGSASGLAYLAFCPKEQRDTLMEVLAQSKREADRPARNRNKIYESLVETRKQGYAVSRRKRRISDEISMSVPILAEERLLATLTIRFSSTAVTVEDAEERFVPKLLAVAQRIAKEFLSQHEHDALVSAPTGPAPGTD
jgi:IclR family mhp operon transcriptional activator